MSSCLNLVFPVERSEKNERLVLTRYYNNPIPKLTASLPYTSVRLASKWNAKGRGGVTDSHARSFWKLFRVREERTRETMREVRRADVPLSSVLFTHLRCSLLRALGPKSVSRFFSVRSSAEQGNRVFPPRDDRTRLPLLRLSGGSRAAAPNRPRVVCRAIRPARLLRTIFTTRLGRTRAYG